MTPAQRALIDTWLASQSFAEHFGPLQDAIRALLADRDRLAERVRELELDGARLDWLEQQNMVAIGQRGYGDYWWYAGPPPFKHVRAQVDAVRAALAPAASPGRAEDKHG